MDLNCDMGEHVESGRMDADEGILPWVTSVSIACGFHAGDPGTMRRTVRLAVEHGVFIGAHPGLPDRIGFGRRRIDVSPEEAYEMTLYQIGALGAIVRGENGRLRHVKPHGALYHMAAADHALAEAIVQAIKAYDHSLCLYAPPSSALVDAGRGAGLRCAIEAFVDRRYRSDGTLASREEEGAIVEDPEEGARIAVELVVGRQIRTVDGGAIVLDPDTICLHGDTPGAALFARRINQALREAGVELKGVAE